MTSTFSPPHRDVPTTRLKVQEVLRKSRAQERCDHRGNHGSMGVSVVPIFRGFARSNKSACGRAFVNKRCEVTGQYSSSFKLGFCPSVTLSRRYVVLSAMILVHCAQQAFHSLRPRSTQLVHALCICNARVSWHDILAVSPFLFRVLCAGTFSNVWLDRKSVV